MNLKKNVIWNTLGNIYYLAAQWLTTVLIIRLTGNYRDSGLYSVAMSLSNVFCIIASYNVRNFQTSDLRNQFSNFDYIIQRLTTIALAMLSCVIFTLASYDDIYKILIITSYTLFRVGESLVDVFHGIDQKLYRMDIVGLSYILRGTCVLGFFCAFEIITHNLLITILAMAIGTYSIIFIFDIKQTSTIERIKGILNLSQIKGIYVSCFPMLLYGVALNVTSSIPRFLAEKMLGAELLGYYSSVATPAVIVQSLLNVIFTPFIGTITRCYEEKNKKSFYAVIIKLIVFCILVGCLALAGSMLVGKWIIVDVLYKDKRLVQFCYLLNSTMVCTSIMAIIWLFAILLTITRSMYLLSFATIIGMGAEAILGYVLILYYGLDGINLSLIISYILIIIIMVFSFILKSRKNFRVDK